MAPSFRAAERRLRDDAVRSWRVSAGTAHILFLVPLVGSAAFAAVTLHHRLFAYLVAEDSVLEWLQVSGFTLAAVFGFLLAHRSWRLLDGKTALFFLALAAGSLFIVGEEVSWGQRLLGLETPESLKTINAEDETNVHNIPVLRIALKFAAIALGLVAALGPWLVRPQRTRYRMVVPPLFVTSAFLVVAGYNIARLIFFSEGFFGGPDHFTVARYSEWIELCLAYGVLAFAFAAWRRERRDAPTRRLP